jgi:hypothetical protein
MPRCRTRSIRPAMPRLAQLAIAAVAAALLLGCRDNPRPPVERVQAFCSAVKVGESFDQVLERYPKFDLQPGGFAPDPKERFPDASPEALRVIKGVLAEPEGAKDVRPVCAIYYNDAFMDGDGKVILAEFKERWELRR